MVAEEDAGVAAILAREGVDSLEGLLEKHRQGIWQTAYRFLQDADDALDVTQEVLLKLHQSLSRLRPDTRLAAWLTRVTANASLNFARQDRTRRRHQQAAAGLSPLTVPPAAAGGLGRALAGAIQTLPRGQRAVVTLRLLEGRTFPEIAEAFGVAESTAKVQFARGVRRLREDLKDWME